MDINTGGPRGDAGTNGIYPIAEEERHGQPSELFWISDRDELDWFAAARQPA